MPKILVRCEETQRIVGEIDVSDDATQVRSITVRVTQPFDPLERPTENQAQAEMAMTDRMERTWHIDRLGHGDLLVPENDLAMLPKVPGFAGYDESQ